MKKIFTLLVLMLTAIAVNAATYPVWVKGIQVTDANKNDVLGNGTVKYDSDNKYLVLSGANIAGSSKGTTNEERACIYVQQKITVVIEGNVTLTGNGDYTPFIAAGGWDIKFSSYVGKEANASLTIKSNTYRAMEFWGSGSVEFKMINVNVTGGEYGIYAQSNRTLTLTCCDLSVTGATNAAPIYGFKSITTEETANTSKDLTYDATSRYYRQNGKLYTGTIKFNTEKYGIQIAGVVVTARNRKYILGDNNTQATYDPDQNELTLNNANITTSANSAIYINNTAAPTAKKTLKIKLVGKNKVVHTGGSDALYLAPNSVDSTLIYSTSGGSLDISSSSMYSTIGHLRSNILTFKDCTIKSKATHPSASAIGGHKNYEAKFHFINANVTAETASTDVMTDAHELKFHGCFIKTPGEVFLASGWKLTTPAGSTNTLQIVTGKDNVKPFLYYGKTLKITETGTSTAKVQFNRAMDNLTEQINIQYHVFLAKGKPTGLWTQSYDVNNTGVGSLRNFELKNLEHNTKYTLRLRAMDEAGNYVFYDDIEFITNEDKAPTLPSDASIKVSNITTVGADLSWKAASDDVTAASKILYKVYYRLETESVFKLVGTVTGAVKYTLTGLDQNTSYEVAVIAVDEVGNSSANYKVGKFKTEKAADVKAPSLPADKTIAVSNITPSSADLKWGAASDEETSTDKLSYTITVTKKGTSESSVAGTVIGKTEFALSGLDQVTEYVIDVCATDEAGNSKYYNAAEFTTTKLPDTSAPIIDNVNITVSNITDNSFDISWEAAKDNETASENMKYSISYKGEGGWTIIDVVGVTTYSITGLDESTSYKVKVSATDEAGNISNYNDITVDTDKAADTVAPTVSNPEITLTSADINSLEIKWYAASDNETLDFNLVYKIEFKKASEDTWTSLMSDFTFFKIESLDQDTEYDVKVSVIDEAGNVTEYTAAKFKTILPDAIESILATNPDVKMYNTSGVLVNKNYKGVVIVNGKKYLKK